MRHIRPVPTCTPNLQIIKSFANQNLVNLALPCPLRPVCKSSIYSKRGLRLLESQFTPLLRWFISRHASRPSRIPTTVPHTLSQCPPCQTAVTTHLSLMKPGTLLHKYSTLPSVPSEVQMVERRTSLPVMPVWPWGLKGGRIGAKEIFFFF